MIRHYFIGHERANLNTGGEAFRTLWIPFARNLEMLKRHCDPQGEMSNLRGIAQVSTSFCYYTLSMLPWYALVMRLSVAMTNESQAKRNGCK